MTAPIEDYGLISDRETAALVRRDGSIDWLCWPRFDSDACFAALLGGPENGYWRIGPTHGARLARRYQTDTLVLETDFAVGDSVVRLVDFMPPRAGSPSLVRLLLGLHGQLEMACDLHLRFDYGKVPPWMEAREDGFVACIGPDLVSFRSAVPLTIDQGGASGRFIVSAGDRLAFTLCHGDSSSAPPDRLDAERVLQITQQYWRDWVCRFDRPTKWPQAVRRSLITLRALISSRTGGLVAAPTTSLPEKPGGSLNWDYRYCWVRDATFAMAALLNAGYHEDAQRWRDWILRAVGGTPSELRILYRVDGGRIVNEWAVDWLPGYRWSRPVRVGNAAAGQRQIDVLGEVLDTFGLVAKAGLEVTEQERAIARATAERIEATWREPGQGIWESRGEPHHYTCAKVMAWVGLDRFLQHPKLHHDTEPEMLSRLADLRARIHREVCEEGYHSGLGSFVRRYGGQELDASLLLLPLVGFLPVTDSRIAGTIAAIERELMEDGFILRNRPEGQEHEGALLVCTCWLADCRSLQGRTDAAREAFERVLSVRNDLGLLSEEYSVRGQHLSGNFPQALSHLGVVTTALGLSGPVLRRGGA